MNNKSILLIGRVMNRFKVAATCVALSVLCILGPRGLAAQEYGNESANTVDLSYIYVDNPNG